MIDLSVTATKILNARKEKGFTQEELATRLGISAQAVSKWERALSLPDIDLLLDLSKILDVPIDFLLDKDKTTRMNSKKTMYDFAVVNPLDKLEDDPILILFGVGLIPAITDAFVYRFTQYRVDILSAMGVLLPSVRIKDDMGLAENQCVIQILGEPLYDGELDGSPEVQQEQIFDAFAQAMQSNLHRFVNRHMVKLLVEHARTRLPFCIDGVIPERISLSRLRTILKALVKEGYSIRKLLLIIEVIDDQLDSIPALDNQQLAESIKRELR